MNSKTIFELIGAVDDELLEQSEWTAKADLRRPKIRKAFLLTAAVLAALAVTATAAAVSEGTNVLSMIWNAFSQGGFDYVPSQGVIQAQLEEGQWFYLNGENIAVILPQSPVKIMLSGDGGTTWRESTVAGSGEMEFWGDIHDGVQYYGGFIGFFGDGGGYLVLTAGVRMNNQPMRIYLTGDGGGTWTEIGNPYGVHASVLTGASFSTPEIGFISYRYYVDSGPDIWWTSDGGDTWEPLSAAIPEEYPAEDYRFTPGTPVFDGEKGVYPIAFHGVDDGELVEGVLYMYSGDYGMTWAFD